MTIPAWGQSLNSSFAENGFEQFESRVFERVTFHVEIDKRAELAVRAGEADAAWSRDGQ